MACDLRRSRGRTLRSSLHALPPSFLAAVVVLLLAPSAPLGGSSAAAAPTEVIGTVTSWPQEVADVRGIAAGPDGNLWYTNGVARTIGRITPAGDITVFLDDALTTLGAITAGPDGGMWFMQDGGDAIGRISTDGAVTVFTDPAMDAVVNLTSGPDGNVWFTMPAWDRIGRITPTGAVTVFSDPALDTPVAITAGGDGNVWFTNVADESIGRITPSGVVTTFPVGGLDWTGGIAAGPDGNVWFATPGLDAISRITPVGEITSFIDPLLSYPRQLVAGGDGAMWFLDGGLKRIDMAGTVTEVAPVGGSHLAFGPDGNLWLTRTRPDAINRVTPAGDVSTFRGRGLAGARGILSGPDGNLWFTNADDDTIGRMTPTGEVTTFDDATFDGVSDLVVGPDGNLWFTGFDHAAVGRITPDGVISSFTDPAIQQPGEIIATADGHLLVEAAGGGSFVRLTTDGDVDAVFPLPSGVHGEDLTLDGQGNVWFTYQRSTLPDGQLAWMSPTGAVTLLEWVADGLVADLATGPDGAIWFVSSWFGWVGRITTEGEPTLFSDVGEWSNPNRITTGADGNLWFTQFGAYWGFGDPVVRMTPTGVATPFRVLGARELTSIAAGPDGAVWLTANGIHRIVVTGDPPLCGEGFAGPFPDVAGLHPFCDEVRWLALEGITTGYADTTFRPAAVVQRMAMAAFLYRSAGSPAWTPPAVSPFSDVATDHPFYAEITWLADAGITLGYPDGTFRPTQSVERMAMAAFLYRSAGSPAWTPPAVSPFSDVATDHPFYAEITWLADAGITTGYPDGTFRPTLPVQRMAMAAFLYRYDAT